jgi:hypothetical protein
MRILYVSFPSPGPWLRAVILAAGPVIALQVAPADAMPLAVGGILGRLLTARPAPPRPGTGRDSGEHPL